MEGKTELQRNAIARARRKELESYQQALDIEWLNSRMDDGRMGRCLAQIQREAEMEKAFQERTDHAAIVNARADKETKLGLEVAKVRREEMCQLLRRHYLRERDPTLRELVKKLEAGYVCRDLKQQILHKEYKKLQEKAEENYANSVLLKALYSDKEAMEKEEMEKMKRNTQYGKELQQQMVSRQQQRQCDYEDTLIENKMLEQVMRTLADEDQRELEKKREGTEKMRQEMVASMQERVAWKDKQKQMIINEERQIEEQGNTVADRSSAVIAERERKIHENDEHNQKIGAQILVDDAARLERENLIELLQEQEYLEKNAQDDIAAKDKSDRVRKDMMDSLTDQMETKIREVQRQKEMEVAFRKKAEAINTAEDAREHERKLKIKEKGRQYSEELRKQIEDNAARRKKEHQQEEARAQQVWDYDKSWREEVSEERKKIVTEHGTHVLGSLQAAVLEPEDIPALEEGAAADPTLEHLHISDMEPQNQDIRRPKCNAQCRVLREY